MSPESRSNSRKTDLNLNEKVDEELKKKHRSQEKNRKRGSYQHYTPDQKAKTARYATVNGPAKSAKYFSEKMGLKINESSIRTIRQQYLLRQKPSTESLNEITPKRRWRPKLLGDELDKTVCDYIKDLRKAGGVINTNIVQSLGRGVTISEDPTLLDTIYLSRKWARSIMERMDFKKRKATKGVKHLPDDFDIIKRQYLDRIHKNISEHGIPPSLVIDWD